MAEKTAQEKEGTVTCDITWKHMVTGASLGICGKPAERVFTSHCPRCGYTADRSACDSCWASHKDYGLCGICFTPLVISACV